MDHKNQHGRCFSIHFCSIDASVLTISSIVSDYISQLVSRDRSTFTVPSKIYSHICQKYVLGYLNFFGQVNFPCPYFTLFSSYFFSDSILKWGNYLQNIHRWFINAAAFYIEKCKIPKDLSDFVLYRC